MPSFPPVKACHLLIPSSKVTFFREHSLAPPPSGKIMNSFISMPMYLLISIVAHDIFYIVSSLDSQRDN